MEIMLLITISILGLIGIKNYIKIKDLGKRTERYLYWSRKNFKYIRKKSK